MLDQNAKETLQAPQQGPVNHVGAMALTVAADIGHIEAFRQIEVELNRRGLPLPSDRILDFQVDFRTVKRAAAFVDLAFEPRLFHGLVQRLQGLLPTLGFPHGFLRTRGQIRLHIMKAEGIPHGQTETQYLGDLVLDLFGSTNDVGIVLGKAAHPQQPMQHPALFIPIHRPQFGPAQGQFPIGSGPILVNLDVKRAIHGLDVIIVLVDLHGGIHRIAIEIQVTAGLPQIGPPHMRRIEQFVAVGVVLFLPEGLNDMPNPRPVRMPADQARPDVIMRAEQLKLSPEFAVIAFLGLLEGPQIGIQLIFAGESRPINTLQHGVALIAAKIRTGNRQKLYRPDLAGMLQVRAATQIDEIPALIHRNGLTFGNVGQTFEFERLVFPGKERLGFFATHFAAFERQPPPDQFLHRLFDLLEIVGTEPVLHIEIVVKSVLRRRPDIETHIRKQFLHGSRHHVGGTVPQGCHIKRTHLSPSLGKTKPHGKQNEADAIHMPAHQSRTPLVEGTPAPSGSRRTACRNALPNALKRASKQ